MPAPRSAWRVLPAAPVSDDPAGAYGRLTKLGLMATFLGATWVASLPVIARRRSALEPMELVKLGVATYRIGHMLAYERVATPIRQPFTATVPDESGAGETVVARGRGAQWVLGELLSCPVCAGTWAAMGLYMGLGVAPRMTRTLIDVLTATGAAELLNESIEWLMWRASEARTRVGGEIASDRSSVP